VAILERKPDDALAPATEGATTARLGDWAIYKRLMQYVAPMWPLFALAVLGFVIANGAEAYFARLFGDIIDAFEDRGQRHWLYFPVMMLVVVLLRGAAEFVGEFYLSRISYRVIHDIRCQLFYQLLLMPSAYFDRSSRGHLVSRITFNVAQLRDTATDVSKTLVQDGSKVLILVGVMFWANWRLTLIFLCIAPLVTVVVNYASSRFRRISRNIQSSMGDVTHVANEAVNGYRVVRIYGGEEYERDRFTRASEFNSRQNLRMVATKVVSTQVIQMFVAAALALLIALLFQEEIAGDMTSGDVVFFVGLAGLLANPIKKLSEVNARLQRGLAAAEDVFSQLDQMTERDVGVHENPRARGQIEFRNVSFCYDDSKGDVLHGIDVTIEPGQTVALVGRSGSGKSTLVSLLPRFYDVKGGEILLDGRPLRDYRLANLRSQIALVMQEVVLFNDTLERNIAYGSLENAGRDRVRDAVVRAHADEFIDALPLGLDTVVGENGARLSGGQRQRVAIARALLKDAPILILDEATSALDSESEKQIQAALDEVMRGRTTLVIAHRLSTIEQADLILVIEGGRIVERGRHEELLEAGGTYANLYQSQFSEGTVPPPRSPPVLPPVPRVERTVRRAPDNDRHPVLRAWYGGHRWPHLLRPISGVYGWSMRRRRQRYISGAAASWRAPVPVIVVGNITVGGTGKSPFVIWLINWLKARGFRPGVVSRGYGGNARRYPLAVNATTSTVDAGDEAPMIVRRTGVPMVVDPDRVTAVRALLDSTDCDLVVADDGLQHYALARDIEIAVVDGKRGLGNGLCLPAGPLREPPERLQEVDWVVTNGPATGLASPEWTMRVKPLAFVKLFSGQRAVPEDFAGRAVHAVSGIGNPSRFFDTLAELGIEPIMKVLPDHHAFEASDLVFDDDLPIVMTEKDASKVRELDSTELPPDLWYLEIDLELSEDAQVALFGLLQAREIRIPASETELAQ
jgi:ATP-binding cassette, subfamily B, bacterial MsbA